MQDATLSGLSSGSSVRVVQRLRRETAEQLPERRAAYHMRLVRPLLNIRVSRLVARRRLLPLRTRRGFRCHHAIARQLCLSG